MFFSFLGRSRSPPPDVQHGSRGPLAAARHAGNESLDEPLVQSLLQSPSGHAASHSTAATAAATATTATAAAPPSTATAAASAAAAATTAATAPAASSPPAASAPPPPPQQQQRQRWRWNEPQQHDVGRRYAGPQQQRQLAAEPRPRQSRLSWPTRESHGITSSLAPWLPHGSITSAAQRGGRHRRQRHDVQAGAQLRQPPARESLPGGPLRPCKELARGSQGEGEDRRQTRAPDGLAMRIVEPVRGTAARGAASSRPGRKCRGGRRASRYHATPRRFGL